MRPLAFRLELKGVEDLTPMLAFTNPKLFDKAVRGGLNYAGRAGKTAIAKQIRANFNIKSARIKQDIAGPYVNTQAGYVEFRFSRKPPTAISYGARGGPRKLQVGYMRGGGRRAIPRGFIAKGLPFMRSVNSNRLNVLHGPSIGAIVMGSRAQFSQQIIRETTARSFDQWAKGVERAFAAEARRRARSS